MVDASEGAKSDPIEVRVARLDIQVGFLNRQTDNAQLNLVSMVDRLARLEERVSHLPRQERTAAIITGVLTVVNLVLAILANAQTLFGHASPLH